MFKKLIKNSAVLLFIATTQFSMAGINEADITKISDNWLGKKLEQSKTIFLSNQVACVQYAEGWVLICTNTNASPIIGYSPTGKFGINETSKEFLTNRIKEAPYIQASKENKAKLLLNTDYTQTHHRNGTPLLTTEWGQSTSPFNDMCPTDLDGNRPPAGCVPTAIAQIMNYWKHPAEGYGMNSYTPGVVQYGRQTVDFSQHTYNWDNMSDNDIAKLFYHVGVAVEVGYKQDGSGASSSSVNGALKYYFGYSVDMQLVNRSIYSDSEWISILKEEINQGRPIYYSGNNDNPGHAWVIDGYDQHNFFHMNFGWSGSSNGYYSLTDPHSTYSNYSKCNKAVIKIQPETSQDRLPDPMITVNYFVNRLLYRNGFTNFDALSINVTFTNEGNKSSNEEIEWDMYIDGDLYKSGVNSSALSEVINIGSSTGFGIGSNFTPGTHTVKFILDPQNKIAEINESNNEVTAQFEILDAGNLPDIDAAFTTDAGYTWVSTSPLAIPGIEEFDKGDSAYFNITITNKRDVKITDPFYVRLELNQVPYDSVLVDGLDFMEKVPISIGYKADKPQYLQYSFILDSGNDIAEAKEELTGKGWGITIFRPNVPNVRFYDQDSDVFNYCYVSHEKDAKESADIMYVDSLAYLHMPIENETDFDITEPFYIEVRTVFDLRRMIKVDGLPAHTKEIITLPYYPKAGKKDDFTFLLDAYETHTERSERDNSIYANLIETTPVTSTPYLPEPDGDMYVHISNKFMYETILDDSLTNVQWFSNEPSMIEFEKFYSDNKSVDVEIKTNATGHIALWYTAESNGKTYKSYRKSLYINKHQEQTVKLSEGWNLLSLNTYEMRLNLHYCFYPNSHLIEEVKTLDDIWRKDYPEYLNSYKMLSPNKAYLVKSKGTGTTVFSGSPAPTEVFPKVQPGLNLLHFPFSEEKRIADYFDSNNCEYVKDLDGFWIPNGTNNSLTHFKPGKAYFVKVKP